MQLSLLSDVEKRQKKAGRVERTSIVAWERVNVESRMAVCVGWLRAYWNRAHDWPTSAELANSEYPRETGWWDTHKLYVRRGLSDALAKGLVEHAGKRTCTVAGSSALTWRVKSR